MESIPRPHQPEPIPSVALSTEAAIRVVRVNGGVVSAARATEANMTMAKAQRESIGGHHSRFASFAKGFLPLPEQKFPSFKVSKPCA
jgi:hypothetical protein